MKHCPSWILGVVSAHVTNQYISTNQSLIAFANFFSARLAEHYDDVPNSKLSAISEQIMTFLVEVDAENINDIFSNYIYYRTSFTEAGEPRKMKTLFSSAFAPSNIETNEDDVFKSFKVFTFRYRARGGALGMPSGWDITDVEKISWLGDLLEEKVSSNSVLGFD